MATATFRDQHRRSDADENEDDDNDEGSAGDYHSADEGEEHSSLVNRLLAAQERRPKAVAKRRFQPAGSGQPQGGQTEEVQAPGTAPARAPGAGKLWAETAVMQTLEQKIASGSSSTIGDMHDRGTETYYRKEFGKEFDLKKRKRRRPDDISDSLMEEEETMGEEANAATFPPDLDGGQQDGHDDRMEKPADANQDPVESLWEGVDTGSVELPIEKSATTGNKSRGQQKWRHNNNANAYRGRGGRGNQFKRFKQDSSGGGGHAEHHQHHRQQRGGWRGGHGGWKPAPAYVPAPYVPAQQFLPRRLIAANYDQEKLFSTTLEPEGMDERELAKALAEALGEKEPALMAKAVEFAGKQLAVELFKECQEVEKRGGLLTKKEDRRKAPGGVFLQLFGQRAEIPEEQKKALNAFGFELVKQSGTHPKWWDKRKQKKEARMAADPPELENEDLPTSSELLLKESKSMVAKQEEDQKQEEMAVEKQKPEPMEPAGDGTNGM